MIRPFNICIFLLFISASVFSEVSNTHTNTTLEPLSYRDNGRILTIKGSNTIGAKLAPQWAKGFLESKGASNVTIEQGKQENEYRVVGKHLNDSVYINIHAHGSSTGFVGLNDRSADIAMSSRRIKDKENEKLSTYGNFKHFDFEHVVAIDGLAIIVHPANPIHRLTKEQTAQIFSGQITSWRSLGGPDLPINVYARDHKSGTWDTFKGIVLNKKYSLTPSAARFESNDQLSAIVSRDVGAIGFVGLASVLDAKAVAISDGDGAALLPQPIYVATEDYPLARRLFMYAPNPSSNRYVNEFLRYVQTNTGQKTVADVGFISQKPISITSQIEEGPEAYIKLVNRGKRLSVNFRFKEGMSDLDNKARRDIKRIVDFMKAPENRNKRIQLIGFGDVKNTGQRSELLSKLRAMSVKAELHKQGVFSESVTGFGAYLPVAPNTDEQKIKNRRVEVWIFDKPDLVNLRQIKKDASIKKRQESTTNFVTSH